MAASTLAADLEGVAAGLLTPFDEAHPEEIRYEELAATAKWLFDGGIRIYLACANISEYHSLSTAERIESVRVVSDTLDSRATILGGAGGSTKGAIELAQAHESNGADGIMIMPPDHAFIHEQGVARYYRRIADAVDIGVVPYIRGMDVTVELMDHITEHENVVGIKWAVSDIELFSKCVEQLTHDVVWMCGMAEPVAPAYYMEGATGFSAGVTNFEPALGLALFDALRAGNYQRARKLRNLSQPLMDLRGEPGDGFYPGAYSVQVVKYGLLLAGQYSGTVREPLVELPDDKKAQVRECYDELQANLETLEVRNKP